MKFSNLSVKTRLFSTIAIMGFVLIVVGGLGLRALDTADESLDGVVENRLKPVQWITEVNSIGETDLVQLDTALLSGSAADAVQLLGRFHESDKQSETLWAQYSGTKMADGEQDLADAFWRARAGFIDSRGRTLDALRANRVEEARSLRAGELAKAFAAQQQPMAALLDLQEEAAASDQQHFDKTLASTRNVSIAAILIGLSIALGVGLALIRSIMRALDQAVAVAERIAQGKLNTSVTHHGDDEFGRLLRALGNMDEMLTKIVTDVRTSATTVGHAARELSIGNDDLSQRTQEQASALEETASSMEEMTATVKQNSDNARQANELAASARMQADHGGTVVARAVSAMTEINEASRKIADIISVIDGIAFQTNLLALNAAVEAARAGEQGRGFAVVASEVRNLAQRSASAAKEIKDLIGNSVSKVDAGSALVNESGETLQSIVAEVKKVAEIVAEISAASDEQAAGIEQVNTAVTQMDSVTQQNAALVEQAAAASKAMEERTRQLVKQTEYFTVGNQGAGLAVSAPPESTATASGTVASIAAVRGRNTTVAKRPSVKRVSTERAGNLAVKAEADEATWQEF